MLNMGLLLQDAMGEKVAVEDLLRVKEVVERMDLGEFKTQWHHRADNYANLSHAERLKIMVMSIKILQANADLKRMMAAVQDLAAHPKADEAIRYYLRTNLWKFLDNFPYLLVATEVPEHENLECLEMLENLTDAITRDDDLRVSAVTRIHKLVEQIQILEHDRAKTPYTPPAQQMYQQLQQRLTHLLNALEPPKDQRAAHALPTEIEGVIEHFAALSIARISIEKSGILSMIQLLQEQPLRKLDGQRAQLEEALAALEQQSHYAAAQKLNRNQCAYALIILLEIIKIHRGLPVLIARIFDLCAHLNFPAVPAALQRELHELKGKVAEIAQNKIRPLIEDILWKNPTYLTKIPYIRVMFPWCYRQDRPGMLNITYIRRVITTSFDQISTSPGGQFTAREGSGKSHLSEMMIEILGLLVNLEPSPHFLKQHVEETRFIKYAQKIGAEASLQQNELFDKQYVTYQEHIKFLEDSIEYYEGISEKMNHPEAEETI